MILIETMLLHALLNFLLFGSCAGLIVGATLIVRPHWMERVSLFANRWIPTRQFDKSLERIVKLDPCIYRYHRASGALILVGAVYVLYFFTALLDKASAIPGLSKLFRVPTAYIDLLFDPLVMIALLGATFALFVSLFVIFRPSLMRGFEHGANQWLSLRHALKPLEISRGSVDEFTFRHTQQMGAMLVLGSLYILVLLIFWAR